MKRLGPTAAVLAFLALWAWVVYGKPKPCTSSRYKPPHGFIAERNNAMEILVTCRFCEIQETVFVAGNYALVDCQGCGETNEVDVDALLELETQETPTQTATA